MKEWIKWLLPDSILKKQSFYTAYVRRFDELARERMTREEMLDVNEYKTKNGHVGLALRLLEEARAETTKWTRKEIDVYLQTHDETLVERAIRLNLNFWEELRKEKT